MPDNVKQYDFILFQHPIGFKRYFQYGGVLEIELDASCDSGWDDWKPNEAKQVTRSIRNIGNKKAYLRVEITGQWESKEPSPITI